MNLSYAARVLALLGTCFSLAASPASAAPPADDDNPFTTNNGKKNATDSAAPKAPEPTSSDSARAPKDTALERASLEMASYTDSDHVTVMTPSVAMAIENVTSGASLRGSYLVDVVSAASVDIVSTASRRWEEVRHAGTLSGEYKPHDFGVNLGGSASSEPDYLSWGVSLGMSHDFDAKNRTLSLGYGYSHDTAGRCGIGGGCTSFSVFSRELSRSSFTGGVTQVIDKATVLSASFDVVLEKGDQSKVYRYIPMFSPDEASRVPAGASIAYVTDHRLPERPLEQLPLSRHRFALTGRIAHRFDGSTLRVSERLYDDSWGLKGSTTDARFIVDLGRHFAVWPHLRYHLQQAVSFWQRAYVSRSATGWDLPELRTGDRELGPLSTITGGGGMKWFASGSNRTDGWALGVQADAGYTSYTDDLYLTSRTSILGAMTLEGTF